MHKFWGKVIRGKKRGMRLGFPTANIFLHKFISQGAYVSIAKIDKQWYKSVSFVGGAKTYGEERVFGETHIFDFNRDIYGKWISVRLLRKLRGNKKFSSTGELIENIKKDIQEADEYFRKLRAE